MILNSAIFSGMTDDTPTNTYFAPNRRVKTNDDMQLWLDSKAYSELIGFIMALNKSVKGKSVNCPYNISENISAVVKVFGEIRKDISEIPLQDSQEQRFGNKAFRDLGKRIVAKSEGWIHSFLPADKHSAIIELKPYLDGSFGNFTRIDYGTGHEISFIAFCLCLYKVGYFSEEDYLSTVFLLFRDYLQLMRHIQVWYKLEPAGSHGVWGLDDYQFLPFVFGSSQFVMCPYLPQISPEQAIMPDVVAEHQEHFLYLECIKFINEVKTGPFGEHSNQLYNISAVQTWTKVNSGLIKMYKAEVLAKFPVIQHLVFGSLLSFDQKSNARINL